MEKKTEKRSQREVMRQVMDSFKDDFYSEWKEKPSDVLNQRSDCIVQLC